MPRCPTGNRGSPGRVTYGFDKRYLFEANFGYNGSENFAAGKRFSSSRRWPADG